MTEQEEFITINGFPNYKINCYGKVINTKKNNKEMRYYPCPKGYPRVKLSNSKSKTKRISRLVYEHFGNYPEVLENSQVEHWDQDPKNNYINNLRLSNQSQNNYNRKNMINSTSNFKGVSYNRERKKWESRIQLLDGRAKFLGRYKYQYNAALAYDIIAKYLHGEYYKNKNFNDFDGEIPDSDEGAKAKAEIIINNL